MGWAEAGFKIAKQQHLPMPPWQEPPQAPPQPAEQQCSTSRLWKGPWVLPEQIHVCTWRGFRRDGGMERRTWEEKML